MRTTDHRAPSVWLAATLLVLSAATFGCSTAKNIQVGRPTSAPTTPTTPSESSPTTSSPPTSTTVRPTRPTPPQHTTPGPPSRPKVGNCYAIGPHIFETHHDPTSPVLCSARHTAETFAVVLGTGRPSASRLDAIQRGCAATFRSYVGGLQNVSRVSFTVMEPGPRQLAAGQRWVRCDAIEMRSFNRRYGVPRTGSLRGALRTGVPHDLRGCSNVDANASHVPIVYISCSAPHKSELIPQARVLGPPGAPYPGLDAVQKASREECEQTFRDYVTSTNSITYYYPTPESWKRDSHTTACWAVAQKGRSLAGF